jgi:hypothetical protein
VSALPRAYAAGKTRAKQYAGKRKTVPKADTPRPNAHRIDEFPKLPEEGPTGLRTLVTGLVRQMGLNSQHEAISIGSPTGWPDLPVWGHGTGIMARELKGSDGTLTVRQLEVLQSLRDAGVDADIWWPEDWFCGRVLAELTAFKRRVFAPLPPLVGQGSAGGLVVAKSVAASRPVKVRGCGCPLDPAIPAARQPHLPSCVWGGG